MQKLHKDLLVIYAIGFVLTLTVTWVYHPERDPNRDSDDISILGIPLPKAFKRNLCLRALLPILFFLPAVFWPLLLVFFVVGSIVCLFCQCYEAMDAPTTCCGLKIGQRQQREGDEEAGQRPTVRPASGSVRVSAPAPAVTRQPAVTRKPVPVRSTVPLRPVLVQSAWAEDHPEFPSFLPAEGPPAYKP